MVCWRRSLLIALALLSVALAVRADDDTDAPGHVQAKVVAGVGEQSTTMAEDVDSLRALNEAEAPDAEASLPPSAEDLDIGIPSLKDHDDADLDNETDEDAAEEDSTVEDIDTAELPRALREPGTDEQSVPVDVADEDTEAVLSLNTAHDAETEQSVPVTDLADEVDHETALPKSMNVAAPEAEDDPFYGPHSDLAPGADLEEEEDEESVRGEADDGVFVDVGKVAASEQSVERAAEGEEDEEDGTMLSASLNHASDAETEQTMPILDPSDPALHEADEFPALNHVMLDAVQEHAEEAVGTM